jgi:hydrogenase maturation protein HypF
MRNARQLVHVGNRLPLIREVSARARHLPPFSMRHGSFFFDRRFDARDRAGRRGARPRTPTVSFPTRYHDALAIVRARVRVFPTTSAGRLFDTVAALLGFTRPITFEGQAAMWLEHLARGARPETLEFPCPLVGTEIDWRGTLAAVIDSRLRGVSAEVIARAFHRTLAREIADASLVLSEQANVDTVVLSGGVIQNDLLLSDIHAVCHPALKLWTNRAVPPNDGGISLGQAAMAAMLPAG